MSTLAPAAPAAGRAAGHAAGHATGSVQRAVRTYLDHLVVERGLADNTLKSYRRDLRRYLDFLAGRGVTDLSSVREATVTEFLVHLREGDAGLLRVQVDADPAHGDEIVGLTHCSSHARRSRRARG